MTSSTDLSLPANIVGAERSHLVNTLHFSSPTDPTLCEGWECRHMVAHLLLRETSMLTAAGVMGGPLGRRTETSTQKLADTLLDRSAYDDALHRFANLPGYLAMRHRFPSVDCAMNLIEYFVHAEDIRRAQQGWEPRDTAGEVQQKIWDSLRGRTRLLVSKHRYPNGLVLEAPGYSPELHTVITPSHDSIATVLSAEPGELILYLFGRTQAQVKVI